MNFQTLDLNLLRLFDEVMSERSLTRAAHNLSITQPAASNAIRRLRDVMGDELVYRVGAKIEPTPRAVALWPVVRDALKQLEHALAPSDFNPLTAEESFVLAIADATATELMPSVMRILDSEAPSVSLQIVPLTTRDPRELLSNEAIDLAVGYFPAVTADLTGRIQSGDAVPFESARLYSGRYICAMRTEHPLAHEPLTLDRFCAARHALVSFSGQPWGFVDEALKTLGRERRVVLTVNQFFTASEVVAHSDLLTVLPEHFLPHLGNRREITWHELPLPLGAIHIDMVWHRRSGGTHAHDWLRGVLKRSVPGAAHSGQLELPVS